MELLRPFLPINHPIRDQFMSILGRATSNEHRWSGTEVFVRYAMPDMPVALKLLAERAVVLHMGLDKYENPEELDSRISAKESILERMLLSELGEPLKELTKRSQGLVSES